jgi:TorA maturation chaperone TorD
MELFRTLGVLAEPPTSETERLTEVLGIGRPPTGDEYAELFLFQLYPYASVYLGPEGMLGGEARDRVAGFWRAIEVDPPGEPDHVAVLLALYAHLVDLEDQAPSARQKAALGTARAALLWEHLLSWLPVYLDKIADLAPEPYRRWGELLMAALEEEARRTVLPEALPLHLRATESLTPQKASSEDLSRAVLAPLRCGMIVTRTDLARAARQTGLGLRAGERRFALDALLAQDAPAMCRWFQDEALTWVQRHRNRAVWLPAIAGDWATRAQCAADALGGVQLAAAGTQVPEAVPSRRKP